MPLAVALLAAGCTGGDDSAGPEQTISSVPASPVDGGTLRVGLPGRLLVDPVEASVASPSDLMVLDLLYDGLTSVDGGEVKPALAESWEVNDEQTDWVFTLDPDATFSSGREVTAEDVVQSLERVAAGGDASLAALALERVAGFRAFVDGEAETLAGLVATDDGAVQILLDGPLSVLPTLLASPVFGVVDAAGLTDEGADLADLDLTGGWVPSGDDDRLVVERAAASGYLEATELVPFDDAEEAYEAFEDGDVDWAMVPPSRIGDALDQYGDDHFAPFQAVLLFGLNQTSPALGNADLRRAIVAAIDRDAIMSAVYADRADPLASVVPAGLDGYTPATCDACQHDPERAAELVEQAFPDGDVPEVHIDFDESSAQERMASIIRDALVEVGIPAKLRPRTLDEYKRFVVSGAQEVFSFGWIGTYESPDAYLAPLFGSAADDNLTRFRSDEVDGLLQRARGEHPDRTKDPERWDRVEAEVLGAAVVVPIAQFRTQVVVAPRVQDLAHALDGTVDWSQIWLADAG